MMSVGLLVVICLAAHLIWGKIIDQAGAFGAMLGPFTPSTAVRTIVDPTSLFGGDAKELAKHVPEVRMMAFTGSVFAAAVVAAIVAGLYKGMVRNFDMVVRKQSAR
jgi:uncharacterized membrane protein YdcZ (DUF606 family)